MSRCFSTGFQKYAFMDEFITHDRQHTSNWTENLGSECEGASQPELNFALMDEFVTHNRQQTRFKKELYHYAVRKTFPNTTEQCSTLNRQNAQSSPQTVQNHDQPFKYKTSLAPALFFLELTATGLLHDAREFLTQPKTFAVTVTVSLIDHLLKLLSSLVIEKKLVFFMTGKNCSSLTSPSPSQSASSIIF